MLKVAVITISDRAFRGEYADLSGPAVRDALTESLPETEIIMEIVPDEKEKIARAIEQSPGLRLYPDHRRNGTFPARHHARSDKRNVRPRPSGYQRMAAAGIAGRNPLRRFFARIQRHEGKTIIVNFPGSVSGAGSCARLMATVMAHGAEMIHGAGHETSRS